LIKDESYISYNHRRFSYFARGRYFEQLQNWLKFFDKRQFLFLNSEKFYSDTTDTLNKVTKFLNISNFRLDEYKAFKKFKYNKLDSEFRSELNEYFKNYNEKLYDLVGENYNWS
jgi:hypothetical protein